MILENTRLNRKEKTLEKVQNMDLYQIVSDLKDRGQIEQIYYQAIINANLKYFQKQPNIISISSPVLIVGDIHGQFYDLINIFETKGYPPKRNYLFLGDYVDRGNFSIQVLTIIMWLHLKYPKSIFLLRGNHQSRIITSMHDFRNQCLKKYSIEAYQYTIKLFQALPLCCIVDGKYFCVHAGISPELSSMKKIQQIDRFRQIPEKGLMCDLLWSDPCDDKNKQWKPNKIRSCSYTYSKKHAQTFLTSQKMRMIIRGHQVFPNGYKYQESLIRGKKSTLTIFSAPNYCRKYKNLGAVASIDNNQISIITIKWTTQPYVLPGHINVFQWTIPYIAKSLSQVFVTLMTKKYNISVQDIKIDELNQLKNCTQPNIRIFCNILQDYEQKLGNLMQEKCQDPILEVFDSPMNDLIRILYFMAEKISDEKKQSRSLSKIQKNSSRLSMIQTKTINSIFGPKIQEFPKVNFHPQK